MFYTCRPVCLPHDQSHIYAYPDISYQIKSTYAFISLLCSTYAYTTTARVTPEKVSTSPQALITNVHWRFPTSMDSRIKGFLVKVTQYGDGGEGNVPVSESTTGPTKRFATLPSLKPSTAYDLKVIAEYDDGIEAESEKISFTTSGNFFLTLLLLV